MHAAGSLDMLIAGYATANDVSVLAAHQDFDRIARITELQPGFMVS